VKEGENVETIDRIVKLLDEKNISANKMATDLQLPNSAFSIWKKGQSKPSSDAIIKIANYLETTTDYLLTGKLTDTQVSLMEGLEFAFLEGYKALDDEDRAELNRAAQRMLELKRLREDKQ